VAVRGQQGNCVAPALGGNAATGYAGAIRKTAVELRDIIEELAEAAG
jgi:hypothetical protein